MSNILYSIYIISSCYYGKVVFFFRHFILLDTGILMLQFINNYKHIPKYIGDNSFNDGRFNYEGHSDKQCTKSSLGPRLVRPSKTDIVNTTSGPPHLRTNVQSVFRHIGSLGLCSTKGQNFFGVCRLFTIFWYTFRCLLCSLF